MESVGVTDWLLMDRQARYIDLSEINQETLGWAMSVTQVYAVQSEFSLWSRKVETGVLQHCEENQIAMISFGPVDSGFVAGGVRRMNSYS